MHARWPLAIEENSLPVPRVKYSEAGEAERRKKEKRHEAARQREKCKGRWYNMDDKEKRRKEMEPKTLQYRLRGERCDVVNKGNRES